MINFIDNKKPVPKEILLYSVELDKSRLRKNEKYIPNVGFAKVYDYEPTEEEMKMII